MNQEHVDFRSRDLHRRIALVLRKEPGLVRIFAERLRSKLAAAKCVGGFSDDVWEWYIILTLWPPLQVIRLLEESSERAVRLRQKSPFISLLSTPEQRGTDTEYLAVVSCRLSVEEEPGNGGLGKEVRLWKTEYEFEFEFDRGTTGD